jgi:hypothetical protein
VWWWVLKVAVGDFSDGQNNALHSGTPSLEVQPEHNEAATLQHQSDQNSHDRLFIWVQLNFCSQLWGLGF